jgi:hypothetical protein
MAAPAAHAGAPLEFGTALGGSWYDHRASIAGPTTFTLRSIKPYLSYDGRAANWDVRGLAQRRFEFYSGHAIDTVLNTSRHAHDRMNLRALRRWSEREELNLEGDYVHSHDMLEADQGTVVANGNVTRWSAGIGSRLPMFEAATRVRATSYDDDSSLVDSRAFGGTARLMPVRRAIDSVFLGLGFSQLEVGQATALISRLVSAGYRRRVAPLVTAEIEAGAAEARFSDGARQILPMIAAGLERDPARGAALGFALHARFEGDSAAALAGEGRYRMAEGRLWLRAESMADAEGGIYRHATRTSRFALGVEDTVARANVIGFEGSYTRTRALRGAGKGTEILRTTGWAMRRIQPWLNLRIAGSYLREPLGAPPLIPIYRRIRLDAELIVLYGGFARR